LKTSGAEFAGGNSFIAAFAAGLVLGNVEREICMTLYHFAEAVGQLLMLFSFVVFSANMLLHGISALPLTGWYAGMVDSMDMEEDVMPELKKVMPMRTRRH
jgi:hypothetical protein